MTIDFLSAPIQPSLNPSLNVWDFGREIDHEGVSRCPPISLYTIAARTESYTYAAKDRDLSVVQGPFSVAACQTLTIRNFVNRCSACVRRVRKGKSHNPHLFVTISPARRH
jgi:hypothetical protein